MYFAAPTISSYRVWCWCLSLDGSTIELTDWTKFAWSAKHQGSPHILFLGQIQRHSSTSQTSLHAYGAATFSLHVALNSKAWNTPAKLQLRRKEEFSRIPEGLSRIQMLSSVHRVSSPLNSTGTSPCWLRDLSQIWPHTKPASASHAVTFRLEAHDSLSSFQSSWPADIPLAANFRWDHLSRQPLPQSRSSGASLHNWRPLMASQIH